MIAKINQLLQEVEALKAANPEELEALRIKYLSKKGAINDLMADFRNVAAEQKKEVGMRLNELKNKAQEKIAALKEQFESQDTGCDDIDLTRSAYPIELGTRHPLSIVRNEIIDIFARMGFNIADGPEMEDDWHVFSSMNFAEDHPARDMQDTFFIENDTENVSHSIILRTHTSSVQSRVMETTQPPIRVLCPGRVYDMIAKINQLLQEVEALKAANAEELEALRIKYLSKKGAINDLMADFRNVAAEQKKEVGMRLNELKNKAQEKIAALKEQFESQDTGCDDIDLTRSAYPIELGTRHPLSIVRNEIIDIFARMGFNIADGPEMEDDWHVFSSMNFAEDHPARDMQDTFFIENDTENVSHSIILRTHTSSVQSRVMETTQPPIRVLCPGRVYRNEAISYRAHAFFHQVEALYVDRNVSFTDLKQALLLFAQEMFGSNTKIRLRPSYFPFTEPSAEMDISCNICGGKGCPFCKHTGWVEILGCGMVDPNVLELNGIDSKVYSGYALGMGIERITNLKYQVKDLRMFSENDTRFLKEFESAY